MKTFNVVFTGDAQSLIDDLQSAGVVVNKVLIRSKVLNVSANDGAKLLRPNITLIEEEGSVTPTPQAVWQQLRLVTQDLPLAPAYNAACDGDGVTIYLVDTGVDTTHPELVDALITEIWSHDGSSGDEVGHGTTLATLMVGKTIGISPKAHIKVVKIPTGAPVGTSVLLEALEAVLIDHSQTTSVKVVNCSWLISKSQILDTKITELEAANLVVVAAAGNDGVAADSFSPVGLDSVLGVAACDAYDRVIPWGPSDTSNYGPEVDITAPGIDIVTIDKAGATGKLSGTSVAAAITSAVVAQFIEYSVNADAKGIQDMVLAHALDEFLFRNESVYGTTPNKLLHTITTSDAAETAWKVTRPCIVDVQLGGKTTFSVPYVLPIERINISGFNWPNGTAFYMPSWISFAETDKLTVAPPATLTPGKYPLFIEGLDAKNKQYILPVLVRVYKTSPAEVASNTTEQYLNDSGEWVNVHLEFCTQDSDCQPPSYRFCDTSSNSCAGSKV
jgi:hypothetical protein